MNRRSSIIVASLALLLLSILAVGPAGALAAETFKTIDLNLTYPSFGGLDLDKNQDLASIIGWLYYAIVTISGLAAFAMLVWGGVQWLTSSGNPGQIKDAQSRMSDALLGLGVVLGSYLILTIVNSGLTTLEQPELEPVPATTSKGYSGIQGVCAPPPADSGCSPSKTPELNGFGLETTNASLVCQGESRGEPWARNFGCLTTKNNTEGADDYSVGLFQINLLAHCRTSSSESPFLYPINDPSYPGRCKIINQAAVNRCLSDFGYGNAPNNIQKAIQIKQGVPTWYPTWGAAGVCSNIPR